MPNCNACALQENNWCDIWNCFVDEDTGFACQHFKLDSTIENEHQKQEA